MPVFEIKAVSAHCPDCGHYKSAHSKGVGCLPCTWLKLRIDSGELPPRKFSPCRAVYTSGLPAAEVEAAILVPATENPFELPCAVCGEIWGAHKGMLCPSMASLFIPMIRPDDPAFISG